MQDAVNTQFLQEALSNEGPFAFEYYNVRFEGADNPNSDFYIRYRPLDTGNTWTYDWVSFINQKSADGWEINATLPFNSSISFVYELRRKTE